MERFNAFITADNGSCRTTPQERQRRNGENLVVPVLYITCTGKIQQIGVDERFSVIENMSLRGILGSQCLEGASC